MGARILGDLGISQPQGDGLRRTHAAAASLQDTGYGRGMGAVYVRGWEGAKGLDLGPASFTVTLVWVQEAAPRRSSDGRATLD